MAPVPPSGLSRARCGDSTELDALLADLGPRIRRGERVREPLPRCATGLAEIDRLLGGGFPRGRLSEVTGAPSSGRTSLVLALLATLTSSGECAGVVDWADAFDPPSARSAGVDLRRVLWVRSRQWRDALGCVERLLATEGFPLVVFDLASAANEAGARQRSEQSSTNWLRLARQAAATRSALVAVSSERLTGAHAELALEMRPTGARFTGTPVLLEELETEAVLVRHRSVPEGRVARVHLAARSAA